MRDLTPAIPCVAFDGDNRRRPFVLGKIPAVLNSGEVVPQGSAMVRKSKRSSLLEGATRIGFMGSARDSKTEKAVPALTSRERQIIGLVSEGLSNKEIARR